MKIRLLSFLFFTLIFANYEVVSNQIVVRFDDSVAPLLGFESPLQLSERSDFADAVSEFGEISKFQPSFRFHENFTEKHHQHNLHQFYTITFESAVEIDEIIAKLSEISGVMEVFPNYKMEAFTVPNDPYFDDQWAHENHGQAVSSSGGLVGTDDCDTDTDLAWDISQGSPEITIAILDTGVDGGHSEFSGRMAPGYDFVNNDTNASDDHGHGTSCAGIAAAEGNNGSGIAGVTWLCKIMPVKVLDSGGSGDSQTIAEAVQWASDNGANVISMSLGGGGYESIFENAINYATENGTVVFAASGNDNSSTILYPAAYENCIAVGALSPCNERKNTSSCDGENWWGSNYGNGLDFLSPGVRIHTTSMGGGYTTTFNGTSSACPHAAGIGGLVLSVAPFLMVSEVRQIMQATCDDLSSSGWDSQTGHGRLNAYQALTYLTGPPEISVDTELLEFSLLSGEVVTEDIIISNLGEADLYYWIEWENYLVSDSETGDVEYEWIDISGIGTQAVFDNNDSGGPVFDLDFEFPFFDGFYYSCRINPNGWIGFGEENQEWNNTSIPNSSAPKPAIFGFWDDLKPVNNGGDGSGYAYYHANSERFVVEFDAVDHWNNGGVYTFQMVGYPDGRIRLNYQTMTGPVNSSTIGIQNAAGGEAIQVAYNQNYVQNQMSVEIIKKGQWLSFSETDPVQVPTGESSILTVTIDSGNLGDGIYEEDIVLRSNDFNNGEIIIPVTMIVGGNPCAYWDKGDINDDGLVNVLDIVLVVNIIMQIGDFTECELWAADMNEDEFINILDIVEIINSIFGG